MFNSKLQLYSHVDSFTSYSRVALPGPSESVLSVPRPAQRIRLAPAAWTATHATPHDFSTADCWNCISLHTLAVQSAFVGRATAIPGLTALRALCSLGARTGVLPRGVLTSCAVQVQYPVRRVGTWWGGVAFRFVREQSRTVEYKSLKCRRRRADYVYDLCRAASSLTYYQLLGILAATTSTAVLCAHAYTR